MAMTLTDRRDQLARLVALSEHLRDEMENAPDELAHLTDLITEIADGLNLVDKDGPAPTTMATTLVAKVQARRRDGELTDGGYLPAMRELHTQATEKHDVDAIPGVYPHRCTILTYPDQSRCFVPAKTSEEEEAVFTLVRPLVFPDSSIAGTSIPIMPAVLDLDARMTELDEALVLKHLEFSYSDNSRRTYRSHWTNWVRFARNTGVRVLPAHPSQIALWMIRRAADGRSFGTISFGIAAVKAVHQARGQPLVDESHLIAATLNSLGNRLGTAQSQVSGLNHDDVEKIVANACKPRIGRGGRLETKAYAEKRGRLAVALVLTMYWGLLRTDEVLRLTWMDLHIPVKGLPWLFISKSKTDQVRAGAKQFVPMVVVRALEHIRGDAKPNEKIFAFTDRSIRRRIKAEAKAAGLIGNYSGHSGRVGMAQDLAKNQQELPEIMVAGRWASTRTAVRYTENQRMADSPTARFFDSLGSESDDR